MAWPWANRWGNLVDILSRRLKLPVAYRRCLTGGSWLGLGRGSAWTRRNLIHTLGAWLWTMRGRHHVNRVRAGLCRTRSGVGWVHGCVLDRWNGLGCKPHRCRRWFKRWFGIGALSGKRSQYLRGGIWSGRRGLLLLIVIHANKDLEAISRDDALASMERAEPPTIQPLSVSLQHCHDVAFAEGQLVRRLGHIVVQGLGQNVL